MKINRFSLVLCGVVLAVAPGFAQNAGKDTKNSASDANLVKMVPGQKAKVMGVIINRDADNFIVRDLTGGDVRVALGNFTKVEEKKSNPFRRAKNYNTTLLLRGLSVEVEGKGDTNGSLAAEKIRFTEDALVVARNVETRVTPVEGRVGEAETRITQTEENAKRLSGQLEELAAISNAAKGGAKAAQESADAAIAGVEATNRRMETWFSSLDDYEAKRGITVNFKVNKFDLLPEAKLVLDEIATQAKTEKAYMIEVMGFASADGDENKNRVLSQKRADAVVRYLAENHMIPLRRIITPFGYGEAQPVADNLSKEGREQNRRVEVKILVNKGMTTQPDPVRVQKPVSTSMENSRPRETTTSRVP
ncbi:MAG: OmpA family protein [Acidobacteria bacterium]|nr:OmpA family protein [Acidobacteriota bacterium]MBI3426619.1 OmpA family protein [Acidobacteriota bacterium]